MGGGREHLAVDGDPSRRDPGLGVAALAEPGMGNRLGDAHGLGGLCDEQLRLSLTPRGLTLTLLDPQLAAHEAEACR